MNMNLLVLCRDIMTESMAQGEEAEARPGVRSGHIPGSSNLPYSSFIEKGKLKREGMLQIKPTYH